MKYLENRNVEKVVECSAFRFRFAESESFKTNWGKMTFTEPDYFFDGSKFRLSALKITNPVLKKTYAYDTRNQKKPAPSIKINDVDVALPAN